MSELTFPYGAGSITFELPREVKYQLATPPGELFPLDDPVTEIKKSLQEPIGSPSLKDLALQFGGPVSIVVSDYSRFTPTAIIIPEVLAELHAGGLKEEEITIISAGGLHRPSTQDELKKMLGEDVFSNYKVITHDPDDVAQLKEIGINSRGVTVAINKYVAEARLKVTIGMMEPHHLAGWSGGGKNFVPGVASRNTVIKNHSLSYEEGAGIGRLQGNPLYEDILEVVEMLEPVFMVNVMLNEKKHIFKVYSGSVPNAHVEGARVGESMLAVSVPEQADVVIVSTGGSPRDKDFWQTEGKSLVRVLPVIKEGGTVVLLSECKEGIGHPSLARILKEKSVEDIMQEFDLENFSTLLNKTYRFSRLIKKAKVFFVTSHLSRKDFPHIPIEFFASAQEAVNKALTSYSNPFVLAIPRSGSVLLKLNEEI